MGGGEIVVNYLDVKVRVEFTFREFRFGSFFFFLSVRSWGEVSYDGCCG